MNLFSLLLLSLCCAEHLYCNNSIRQQSAKSQSRFIMATIKNFEEIKAWQKARELAGNIYELTRQDKFSRDFGLRDQIQRAASSVMHNIAE